jgi:hypothetical protein
MEAKFVKCKNVIVNANDVLSIKMRNQCLIIECTNNTHNVYFASEPEAAEELNRIYSILK